MEREEVRITESGTHTFGDNYKLIFKDDKNYKLDDCNITCGWNCNITCGWNCNITCRNNCKIECGGYCNIICGNDCEITCNHESNIICGNNCNITCGPYCNITCGSNCEIKLEFGCYIKGGDGTKLELYGDLLKTISKGEEFIWWHSDVNSLINTFENESWKKHNLNKWKELYPFVHNELDSATLF